MSPVELSPPRWQPLQGVQSWTGLEGATNQPTIYGAQKITRLAGETQSSQIGSETGPFLPPLWAPPGFWWGEKTHIHLLLGHLAWTEVCSQRRVRRSTWRPIQAPQTFRVTAQPTGHPHAGHNFGVTEVTCQCVLRQTAGAKAWNDTASPAPPPLPGAGMARGLHPASALLVRGATSRGDPAPGCRWPPGGFLTQVWTCRSQGAAWDPVEVEHPHLPQKGCARRGDPLPREGCLPPQKKSCERGAHNRLHVCTNPCEQDFLGLLIDGCLQICCWF